MQRLDQRFCEGDRLGAAATRRAAAWRGPRRSQVLACCICRENAISLRALAARAAPPSRRRRPRLGDCTGVTSSSTIHRDRRSAVTARRRRPAVSTMRGRGKAALYKLVRRIAKISGSARYNRQRSGKNPPRGKPVQHQLPARYGRARSRRRDRAELRRRQPPPLA